MTWVATIEVVFGPVVEKEGQAGDESQRTVVAILENPINANQIASAQVLTITEE